MADRLVAKLMTLALAEPCTKSMPNRRMKPKIRKPGARAEEAVVEPDQASRRRAFQRSPPGRGVTCWPKSLRRKV